VQPDAHHVRRQDLAADTPDNLQRLMAGSSQIIAIAAPATNCAKPVANAGIEQFDVSPCEGEFQRCALTPHDDTICVRNFRIGAGAR